MTIIQCKYIIETAKCGSFNEAANRLFISQANLSENVKKLEEEFKIKIFRRSNKGVSLTSDGAEFIRHAEKIVSQAEYMDFCFKNRQRGFSFSVSSQHYDFVAEAFSEFLNKNRKEISSFALKETQTHDVISDVKNSESNIGIIAVKKADSNIMNRFFRKNGISFLQISEASPHVFLRAEHPLADKSELNISELEEYFYISYEQGNRGAVQFSEELTEFCGGNRRIIINDRATLMNLLLSTDSYTVGTGIMTSELNNGSITSVPLCSGDIYLIGVITAENAILSEKETEFIEILRHVLSRTGA